MTEEQIMQAPIEEVAKQWMELFEDNNRMSMNIDAYYNHEFGDIFNSQDVKEFKYFIKKNTKEMNLIEEHKPEIFEYLFGGIEE
jgi:hypothetical protein|nr:MAG TPA: hypothetical protein [Caudoviricetes sp.]